MSLRFIVGPFIGLTRMVIRVRSLERRLIRNVVRSRCDLRLLMLIGYRLCGRLAL